MSLLLPTPAQTIDVLSALQCLISRQVRKEIRGFNLCYPCKIAYKTQRRTHIWESHLNCA